MATKRFGVSEQPFEEIVAEHGPTSMAIRFALLPSTWQMRMRPCSSAGGGGRRLGVSMSP